MTSPQPDQLPILNDFYARTFLRPKIKHERERFSEIIRFYRGVPIKKLNVSFDVDPSLTVSSNVLKMNAFNEQIRAAAKKSAPRSAVKVNVVPTVPLIGDIVSSEDLYRLSVKRRKKQYIFISVPPTYNDASIMSALRKVVFIQKLVPVITCFEKTVLTIPDSTVDALFNLSNAAYQINFSSIVTDFTQRLIKKLLSMKKDVVFGTGDMFDSCPYRNHSYYIKYFLRTFGQTEYTMFAIRHNRFFS